MGVITLTKKRLLSIGIVLIILAAALFATPSVIEQLTVSSYRSYMTNINKPAMLAAIRTNITAFLGYSNQTYSLQDLFKWEGTYMKFVNGALNNRPTDPTAILASGKGKCQEFSILFAAACLSVGYNASLVVVMSSDYLFTEHAFNEVYYPNGSWVQVDSSWFTPTRLVVNDTSIYHDASWWSKIGKGDMMQAFFANGKVEDVTCHYDESLSHR